MNIQSFYPLRWADNLIADYYHCWEHPFQIDCFGALQKLTKECLVFPSILGAICVAFTVAQAFYCSARSATTTLFKERVGLKI
jgi:hypothetical protein